MPLEPKKTGVKPRGSAVAAHKDFVMEGIEQDKDITLVQLQSALEDAHGLKVSLTTIHRALQSFGLTYIADSKSVGGADLEAAIKRNPNKMIKRSKGDARALPKNALNKSGTAIQPDALKSLSFMLVQLNGLNSFGGTDVPALPFRPQVRLLGLSSRRMGSDARAV